MTAIYKREMRAYFSSPIGYILPLLREEVGDYALAGSRKISILQIY